MQQPLVAGYEHDHFSEFSQFSAIQTEGSRSCPTRPSAGSSDPHEAPGVLSLAGQHSRTGLPLAGRPELGPERQNGDHQSVTAAA